MCRAEQCETCGKTTWAGCGDHIESVQVTVPADEWCDDPAHREAAVPA